MTKYTRSYGDDAQMAAFSDDQELEQLREVLNKGTKVRLHYRKLELDEPSTQEATVSRQPFGSVFSCTVEEDSEDGRPIDLREYNGDIELTRLEPSSDRGLGHLVRIEVQE